MPSWGELKSLRGQSAGEVSAGLLLAEKLATPLPHGAGGVRKARGVRSVGGVHGAEGVRGAGRVGRAKGVCSAGGVRMAEEVHSQLVFER